MAPETWHGINFIDRLPLWKSQMKGKAAANKIFDIFQILLYG
jgi:hypothetical protein